MHNSRTCQFMDYDNSQSIGYNMVFHPNVIINQQGGERSRCSNVSHQL